MLLRSVRPAPSAHEPTSIPQGRTPALSVRSDRRRAVSLVEVMFALVIQATVMLAIIGSFIQSRRVTESTVLHAAATSMVYGVIEQIKQLDYTTLLPNYEADPAEPAGLTPPYVRVRVNQDKIVWLRVVHTASTDADPEPTPMGPTETPAADVLAADVKIATTGVASPVASPAIDNFIGSIPLSTVTGTTSQEINLNIWLWIDEIPNDDVSDVKKITMIYTYSYQDGNRTRTIRDREVFLRTRYEQ